jgi:hypothetical protein
MKMTTCPTTMTIGGPEVLKNFTIKIKLQKTFCIRLKIATLLFQLGGLIAQVDVELIKEK